MIDTAGATVLLAAAVVALILVLLLIRTGFRDGDQADDARAHIRLTRIDTPDGDVLHVHVVVENPAETVTLVSVRTRPTRVDLRPLLEPDSRRTALNFQRVSDYELLGAVPGHDCRAWLVAVPSTSARALHVTVILDQTGGRSRVITARRRAPAARPSPSGPERYTSLPISPTAPPR